MKQDREFNRILDECLERLLQGDTPEQCLQKNPEQAVELEPLLRTASAVKEASAVTPNPIFRARAREEFHTALQEAEAKKSFSFLGLRSWIATTVTVLLAVVVLSSSTVAAAGNSMPGEPLYPVKLATEQVQVVFTFSDLDKAELYANLADKRVNEIVYSASKGDTPQVELGAQRLNIYLSKAAVLVGAPAEVLAQDTMVATAQPAPMLSAPAPTLAPVPEPVPAPRTMMAPPVSPESEATQGSGTAESAPSVVVTAPAPVSAPAPASAPQVVKEGTIANTVSDDKRSVLNVAVKNKSAVNVELLRSVLATVPESAKPALEMAIQQVEMNYQRVIDATEPAPQYIPGTDAGVGNATINPSGVSNAQSVTSESVSQADLNQNSAVGNASSAGSVSSSTQANGSTNRENGKQKERNR